ncbi:MAG: type II toxin-antitoxin system VapC family toxin [Pseudomonadota bacterium]
MIIDASALLAILLAEEDAPSFAEAIDQTHEPAMSAVNYLETAIRVDRLDNVLLNQKFDAFMMLSGIAVQPVSLSQTKIARLAYAEFGKGRHRAGLNFGDCFAYALAKQHGLPLLFKGDDFIHTDIESAT